jgi:hypothetical protein
MLWPFFALFAVLAFDPFHDEEMREGLKREDRKDREEGTTNLFLHGLSFVRPTLFGQPFVRSNARTFLCALCGLGV